MTSKFTANSRHCLKFYTHFATKPDFLHHNQLKFVIVAKSNKKIKNILEKHRKESGDMSTVFEYKFRGVGPTFNIVAIWDPKKVYMPFATNQKMDTIYAFVKQISEECRKRWNIEIGYRVKNDFLDPNLLKITSWNEISNQLGYN